ELEATAEIPQLGELEGKDGKVRLRVVSAVVTKAEGPKHFTKEEAAHYVVAPEQKEDDGGELKLRGKGVFLANEAINCLARIPKDDALRGRGLQLVLDWITNNK